MHSDQSEADQVEGSATTEVQPGHLPPPLDLGLDLGLARLHDRPRGRQLQFRPGRVQAGADKNLEKIAAWMFQSLLGERGANHCPRWLRSGD